MKDKRIIGAFLAAVILVSGCNISNGENTDQTAAVSTENSETANGYHIEETSQSVTEETSEEQESGPVEFDPHVYSATLSGLVPQEYWDSFYNLCDALRRGDTEFECASVDAYLWCTDTGVLCVLFPPAGARVERGSGDDTPFYEDGIGKISYTIPVDEYLERQAGFEAMIEEILNDTIESDDTEYEIALKLYLYIAEEYTYSFDLPLDDNYVYNTFAYKIGVCVDLAAVYSYLLLQAGVDAVPVGCYEPDLCHAWTYAVIDGKGYYIDPTWGLKTEYDGKEHISLDYFLMGSEERIDDGCPVEGLSISVLPEDLFDGACLELPAEDSSRCLRPSCSFVALDEDKKTVTYDLYTGEKKEYSYDQ